MKFVIVWDIFDLGRLPHYNGIHQRARKNMYEGYWTVEVHSLKDLLELTRQVGQDLVITASGMKEDYPAGLPVLRIYDDYS